MTACLQCGTEIRESKKIRAEITLKQIELKKRADKRYNYIEALFFCFFSGYFYRDVLRRWKGLGLTYTGFLSSLLIILLLVGTRTNLSIEKSVRVNAILEQLPRISVTNGIIDFEGESPLVIRAPVNEQILVMMSRSPEAVDLSGAPVIFYLTPRQIFFREGAGMTRGFSLSDKLNFVITQDLLRYWIRQIDRWAVYLMYPILWFTMCILILMVALLYSIAGKLAAFLLKIQASFEDLFRMTCVALTPLMFIEIIFMLISNKELNSWVEGLCPLAFLILGLWYNKQPIKQAGVR